MRPGELWLSAFEFSDGSGVKVRPVLIRAPALLHGASIDARRQSEGWNAISLKLEE